MLKKLLALGALVSIGFAGINLYFIFQNPDGPTAWNLARGAASLFVIVVGLLTVWFGLSPSGGGPRLPLWVTSAGLFVLGIAGMGLATFNGLRAGDIEFYLFPINALFIGQALFTAAILWSDRKLTQT